MNFIDDSATFVVEKQYDYQVFLMAWKWNLKSNSNQDLEEFCVWKQCDNAMLVN